MRETERLFLEIIKYSIHDKAWSFSGKENRIDWKGVIELAQEHDILPLIYDTVCKTKVFQETEKQFQKKYQEVAIQQVVRQIVQTNEFLTLIKLLQDVGSDPIVIKGIILRNLYPKGYLRPSVDEDILISLKEADNIHKVFTEQGLKADDPDVDLSVENEQSYHKENSPTYIELHSRLFPDNSEAYGDCNRFFNNTYENSIKIQIEDINVRTLDPTDHLLYLILHAYKHLLHSGFGIRIVCDIALFTENYKDDINWKYINKCCKEQKIELLVIAIYKIASVYLGFNMPDIWKNEEVNEIPLLEDILSGGIYGVNDINRAHSSTMILDMVASQKRGKTKKGIVASLFPSRDSLKGRYPFLKKNKWLLPLAWMIRITKYLKKKEKNESIDPSETVHIANERIRLLKEYKIVE